MPEHPKTPSAGVSRRSLLRFGAGAAALLPISFVTACGAGSSRDAETVRIAYQQFGTGEFWANWIDAAAEKFTAAFPDLSVEPVPIVAAENDYFTKNELLMSSPRTSPDIAYEDMFILLSDVSAGYLQPIDQFVENWEPWSSIAEASSEAVVAEDGRIYGVPTHTDTRALWFNKEVLSDAGLPEDWAPGTWDDVLDAARTIKDQLSEVAPFFMFSGKAQGEKASMQGFQMLLYGTGATLYDEDTQMWNVGSEGFLQSLEFIRTIFQEELTLSVSQHLDPNIEETIFGRYLPEGQLGIQLDGSWVSQNWTDGGARPWPEWTDTMGLARMPTRDGGGNGWVTVSGGWCLTIPEYATDPKTAFSFIEQLCEAETLLDFTIANNYITVRDDIAEDERYLTYSPTVEFFTELLDGAFYRPALPAYPEVSNAIQDAMEAVMTMSQEPEQALASYDAAVTGIVGSENVQDSPR